MSHTRPVKRSRAVPLTLAASAASAAALAACSQTETMQCVDKATGRVVAEANCERTNAPTSAAPAVGSGTATTQAGGIPPVFLWYYGGRVINGLVTGGAYAPLAGRSYRSPGGIAYDRSGGFSRVGTGTRSVGGTSRITPTSRGGFGGIGAGRVGGG